MLRRAREREREREPTFKRDRRSPVRPRHPKPHWISILWAGECSACLGNSIESRPFSILAWISDSLSPAETGIDRRKDPNERSVTASREEKVSGAVAG